MDAISEDDLFDLSIEDLLNITVSGAPLTEESLASVPSSVSEFTREQFKRIGVIWNFKK